MKLKVGEKVYLQIYEILYIADGLNSAVPLQYFFRAGDFVPYLRLRNNFDFVCLFKKPENGEWIMKQDWLVDYDEYAEKPTYEIKAICKYLESEITRRRTEHRLLGESGKANYSRKEVDELINLTHKVNSLKRLIKFRQGKITFNFPSEYRGKTTPDAVSPFTKKLFSFFR
ncbi:hypothetical protein J6S37_01565 [Candidatus Saccharibacteria bacterium]|nr:hypothetical protein [Candidatus Saccharibacteria bacterium]